MIDPFIIIVGIQKGLSDPNRQVLMEIDRRRPGWRRDYILAVTGLLLMAALLIYAHLMGLDCYL